eukprot:15366516-Ditylum_brightwellii.AAC.1
MCTAVVLSTKGFEAFLALMMVKSNANESVPPTEDAEPSLKAKSYKRVLVTPTMDNGPQEKNITQMHYKYRWRISFPAPDDAKITPGKKFTTLLSMIGQFWPSMVLNTWSEKDDSLGITNGKDLPYLQNDLEVYCPHFKRRNGLETSWNISSKVRLDMMKENCAFMQHLRTNHIFINATKLTMGKRDLWVRCTLLHPNHMCRDKAIEELN